MAKAHVYRNLNNGKWSIRQQVDGQWRVVGYADYVQLQGVTVRQSEKARQRVIERGQRDVHCWAIGALVAVDGFTPAKGRTLETVQGADLIECERGITYIPQVHKMLIYRDSHQEFTGAAAVTFSYDQKAYASN